MDGEIVAKAPYESSGLIKETYWNWFALVVYNYTCVYIHNMCMIILYIYIYMCMYVCVYIYIYVVIIHMIIKTITLHIMIIMHAIRKPTGTTSTLSSSPPG